MVGAIVLTVQALGSLQELDGGRRLPDSAKSYSHRPQDLSLEKRLLRETRLDLVRGQFLGRPVEQFPDGGIELRLGRQPAGPQQLIRLGLRIRLREQLGLQEVLDRLGDLLLLVGPLLFSYDFRFLRLHLNEPLAGQFLTRLGTGLSLLGFGLFRFRVQLGETFAFGPLLSLEQPDGRARDARQQGAQDQTRGNHLPTVPLHKLLEAIPRARRAGADRLVVEESLDIPGEAVGRLVAPVAVLAQRLEHDPVEFPLHEPPQLRRLDLPVRRHARRALRGTEATARRRGLLLADQPQHLIQCRLLHRLLGQSL